MRLALFTLLVLAALAGCRGGDSDKPPVHLIQNMMTQEKGRPYRADHSGIFADNRMMRMPVEGTVAIGQLNDDDLFYEGLGPDGGVSLLFPEQLKTDGGVTDLTRKRGEERYQIYCVPCHGALGNGKGLVAILPPGRGLEVPPANFLEQRLKDLPAGKLYSAIRNGVNNGNMPSYAAQIPVEDRWAIISYVRKLQGVGDEGGVASVALAVPTVASAEFGGLVYKAKNCVACHSLNGTRIVGPSWKGVYGKTESTSAGDVTVDDAYIKESILTPLAKIVTGYPPAMPPQPLSEIEIESVILFIKAQK
jgi:mono/diheme cytochrome c family protein